jgi:hypothetical protein
VPRLKSPKSKGDSYERALADYLNQTLFDGCERVRRAPLSGGGRTFSGGGSADLIGLPGVWVEAKRTERFRPYEALEQAERGRTGTGSPDVPVVVTRRNRMPVEDSLVVMRLSNFVELLRTRLAILGELPQRKDAA